MVLLGVGSHLEQWRGFTKYLEQRGIHHVRERFACAPPYFGKAPNWYRRQKKRRQLKRLKRLTLVWATYKKPDRLTEKQIKEKQKKEVIEELYHKIKIMAPHFRMKQKYLSCGGVNVFEIEERKLSTEKHILGRLVEEQSLLLSQYGFFHAPSNMAIFKNNTQEICHLTKLKMRWGKRFKKMLQHRKVLNRRLAERRKHFLNLLTPLSEYYYEIKNQEMVKKPRYLVNVERMVFKEQRIVPKKTAIPRFLQVLAQSQTKYVELREKAKELKFLIQTRFFFVMAISKILNQLNYAKYVVLNLLGCGHEHMNKMFRFHESFVRWQNTREKILTILRKRRIRGAYQCRELEIDVEILLNRHRYYIREKWRKEEYFNQKNLVPRLRKAESDRVRGIANVLARYREEQFVKSMHEDKILMWESFYPNKQIMKSIALSGKLERLNSLLHISTTYSQTERYELLSDLMHKLLSSYCCQFLRNSVRAYDLFKLREAFILEVIKKIRAKTLYNVYRFVDFGAIQELYSKLFKLTKRSALFRVKELGIHCEVKEGNKDIRIKDTFKFFRYFLAIRQRLMSEEEKQFWIKTRTKKEIAMKHRKLIKQAIPSDVNANTFDIYDEEYRTICPLCTEIERQKELKKLGLEENRFLRFETLRNEANSLFFAEKTMLNHDALDCNQPTATFLVEIKVLEDRRKKNYLGKDLWKTF